MRARAAVCTAIIALSALAGCSSTSSDAATTEQAAAPAPAPADDTQAPAPAGLTPTRQQVDATVALTAAVSAPAHASTTAPQDRRCSSSTGLTADLAWRHVTLKYLTLVTRVRWQNCKASIGKITVETRMLDPHGVLREGWTETFTPNLGHSGTRTETRTTNLNLLWAVDRAGFTTAQQANTLTTCTRQANGQPADMTGYGFYAYVIAYDRTGRNLFWTSSPTVACGQNG